MQFRSHTDGSRAGGSDEKSTTRDQMTGQPSSNTLPSGAINAATLRESQDVVDVVLVAFVDSYSEANVHIGVEHPVNSVNHRSHRYLARGCRAQLDNTMRL